MVTIHGTVQVSSLLSRKQRTPKNTHPHPQLQSTSQHAILQYRPPTGRIGTKPNIIPAYPHIGTFILAWCRVQQWSNSSSSCWQTPNLLPPQPATQQKFKSSLSIQTNPSPYVSPPSPLTSPSPSLSANLPCSSCALLCSQHGPPTLKSSRARCSSTMPTRPSCAASCLIWPPLLMLTSAR
ncbi:hypothetical protein I7I50_04833 [Histoplasma capsulatum G186AR]|uniref:Uncharacterized protein n=1 Tax=Ajellomyces capsulatus TaxID=5037 RepID=A0A8H8D7B7_AJECA|nr:hypothetical protein I7I52_03095 [Histoplasma capsulatum]QSS75640.1 hypothetical protein I7I50_04833 [Histoplasma capsulatum G186AR]